MREAPITFTRRCIIEVLLLIYLQMDLFLRFFYNKAYVKNTNLFSFIIFVFFMKVKVHLCVLLCTYFFVFKMG